MNFRIFRWILSRWPVLLGLSGQFLVGQQISVGPRQFDLDIESAINTGTGVQVAVRNSGTRTITAFALKLTATYADGTSSVSEYGMDYFASLGLQPAGSAADLGGLRPGSAKEQTVNYVQKPSKNLIALLVEGDAVIFADDTGAGDPKRVARFFTERSFQYSEISAWCAAAGDLFNGAFNSERVNAFVAARKSALGAARLSDYERGVRQGLEQELNSTFVSALESLNHGNSNAPGSLEVYLLNRCSAAREHSQGARQ